MVNKEETVKISSEQKAKALTEIGLLKECFGKEIEQLPDPMGSNAFLYFQHEGRQKAWDAFRRKTGLVVPVEDVSSLRQASQSANPPTGLSGVITKLMLLVDQKSKQRRPLSLVESLGSDDGSFGRDTQKLLESGLEDPDIIDALAHSPELIHGCNAYLATNPNTREETLKKLVDYGSEGTNSSQQYLSEAIADRENLSLEMAYEMKRRYQDPFRHCQDKYNRSKFDWNSFNRAESVAYDLAVEAMYKVQETDPDAKWETNSKLPPFSEFKDLYGAECAKNTEELIKCYLDIGEAPPSGETKAGKANRGDEEVRASAEDVRTEKEILEEAQKAPAAKWVRLSEHLDELGKVGALEDGEKFHKGWVRKIIAECPKILKEAGQKTEALKASLLAKVSDISRPTSDKKKDETGKIPLRRKQEVSNPEVSAGRVFEGK